MVLKTALFAYILISSCRLLGRQGRRDRGTYSGFCTEGLRTFSVPVLASGQPRYIPEQCRSQLPPHPSKIAMTRLKKKSA